MPSATWGTGTDIFAADYLSAQVPNSGSSEWQSSDIYDNMLSALELKRMSGHFDAGVDTTTGASTPADTPLSLVTEGASPGYYRTIKYSSQYADDYFFSQNILMYDRHIISNVSDIQRLVWKPTITIDTFNNAPMVDGTTSNIKCYSISQFESNKVDILKKGKTDEYTATGVNIVPAIISPDSTNHLQGFNYWGRVDERATWVDRVVYRYNQTYGSNSNNVARYCPVFGNQSAITLPNSSGETSKWAIDDTGNYAVRFVYKAADQYSYLWTTYCNVKYWICSEDELLHVLARSGMKFVYNNTMYKPVAENGVIIGYTDDMEEESEWDNWHDYTDHEVPVTPPTPPAPSGDEYDDMSLGVSNVTLGGLTKYAILSKQELIDLVIDYNTNGATAGTNFSNHIICLYRLGFGASDLVVTSSDKIKMIQSAGDVDFESSANYSIVTRQTPFIHFGSIKVPRHTNTFYDFSPYSNYELYIPGCGWIPLPDNVAGRTLNVYLVFDLPTCSAKGIVRIAGGVYGGTTIATVNGIIGASVPFTIGENGMQRAAILSGSVQTAAALGTAFLGVGIGNPYMGASGVAMATTGIANNYVAGNTNFISTKGGASDFSAFGDGATAMLKYNAPEIDPVVNNSMFGHTVGYLCNEVGTLGSFTGFTVCDNPHVTFSASSAERDEIERLLASGVIL